MKFTNQLKIKHHFFFNYFIMMILFFAVIAPVSGQNTKNSNLSLNVQNQPLSEVFQQISVLTQYKFFYDHSIVEKAPNITLDIRNATIQDILDKITAQTNLHFQRTNNTITVSLKPSVNSVQTSQRQLKTVSGVIIDILGEPIIGANIMEKGTANGTVTDMDGNFSLQVGDDAILQISYIGYQDQEINTGDKIRFDIILKEDTRTLEEVVVIGYGTRQRKNLVGAVDQIGSALIENRPVANTMQALQGAAANLVIQSRSANPNDNTLNINIRGVSTITNNDPLVLIDGIITDLASLNRINPDDIASISVLKDAGSAAIYGSRASSGVLLVTTKTGQKSQKPVVRFNSMVGYETPIFWFEPVKGYENAILRNQAKINVGSAPEFTPEQIRDIYNHTDEEYLLFQILRPALQQTYTGNVSGGSENSTYMVSVGYYDQNSNFMGGDYDMKRYNFRSNVTTEYGKFKLTSQLAYNRIMHNGPNATNAIQNATRWPTYYYYKMIDSKGRYVTERTSVGILEAGGFRKRSEDNVIGNLAGELEIIKGLKAKAVLGIDLSAMHRYGRDLMFPYYVSDEAEEPNGYVNAERRTSDYNEKHYLLNTQFMLDYDRTFKELHHVSGLVGFTNESYTFESNQIIRKFTDPDLGTPAADGLTEFDPASYNTPSGTVRTSIYSLFGRAGYTYANKYYTEASFRYDGSSKFAKNHRWGFFPSLALGWRLSQEEFMDFYRNHVGDLKFRGSYGVLGNQNVGDYRFLTTYTIYNNSYGFNKTATSGTGFTFGNSELEWEKSATFNAGLDATFFNNNLTVSFDWFNQVTSDILIAPEVPDVFGGAVAIENTGKMRNRGWELSLNHRFRTKDIRHNINFNLADSQNEVIDFGDERINDAQQMSTLIREGVALNSYFGLKVAGYFKDEEDILNSALPAGAIVRPGDVKYKDYYEDGVIDDKDRQILGNAFPRYTFGLNYDLSWKGFDFGAFIQGVGQRKMILRGEMIIPFASDFTTTMFRHQLDFWTPDNTDARWPRLAATGSASNNNNYWKTSDIFLLNAAYIRLKNIQVGYTLPSHVTREFGIRKLRLYVNAQNLFTLSGTKFYDPESSEFGNNMGGISGVSANSGRGYPSLRYYGMGFNLEF